MKSNADISRSSRLSKLHIVMLMILTALLLVRVLHAQELRSFETVERNLQDTIPSAQDPVGDNVTERTTQPCYWIDFGLGWGGQGRAVDIGFSREISPQRIISIGYTRVRTRDRVHDYFLLIPTASYPMGEDASAVDVSYGLLKKGKAGIMSFSAGLSMLTVTSGGGQSPPRPATGFDALIMGSTKPADYEMTTSTTVGLALRARLMPSLRTLGLGISPYVNINGKYTFASLTIQLAAGRFRPGRV